MESEQDQTMSGGDWHSDCVQDDCPLHCAVLQMKTIALGALCWCLLTPICLFVAWRLNTAVGILMVVLFSILLPIDLYIGYYSMRSIKIYVQVAQELWLKDFSGCSITLNPQQVEQWLHENWFRIRALHDSKI